MGVHDYWGLAGHIGHRIQCVGYGNLESGIVNVAIECETCGAIILDYDAPDDEVLAYEAAFPLEEDDDE